MRYQTPVALSRVPSAIFRRMRASPGGPDTESAPAGTPHASAQNLTLGAGIREYSGRHQPLQHTAELVTPQLYLLLNNNLVLWSTSEGGFIRDIVVQKS